MILPGKYIIIATKIILPAIIFPSLFINLVFKTKNRQHKEYIRFQTRLAMDTPKFKLNDRLKNIFSWLNFDNINNYVFEFQSNFPQCPLCNFTVHNPNVTRDDSKDLVMSFLIGRLAGVIPFIHTLRSTGCKAQIVIFTDTLTIQMINNTVGSYMKNCGVHIIDMGIYKKVKYHRHIYYIKYLTASTFLNAHSGFGRVLLTDLSDVIFQGNPFLTPLPNDNSVIACEEFEMNKGAAVHWTKGSEYEVLKVLVQIKKDSNISFYPRQAKYYNGGLFFGPVHIVKNHTNNVVNLINSLNQNQLNRLNKINTRVEEQSVHSFAINEYLRKNSSITVINDGPHHEIFMLWGRHMEKNQRFPNFIYKGNYPTLYHLIYMDKGYCKSIARACPPIFNFSNYYRC
ncbi:hypothetical protein TRFO_36810 [Tritrichomonas foetus]|uniref:Nucleotide-diphospho-sugar transferase domain-containing protein n=1 Tax=Tritrichomonas foetus TaxID=1144522 RepID=A0A1J4JHQ8_9EUKA|nr:hypothetical protein TRFO_36810 [Tritrichomonas foetus]|eukprot:OHS97029.1 hypothetical protein TRFO_36810 [Tritrichomonas foetus]